MPTWIAGGGGDDKSHLTLRPREPEVGGTTNCWPNLRHSWWEDEMTVRFRLLRFGDSDNTLVRVPGQFAGKHRMT